MSLAPIAGQAAVLATEGFNYPAGPLAGQGGWASTGTFVANVGAASLAYPSGTSVLPVSGGALIETGNGSTQGHYARTVSLQGDSAGASTIWVSWLMSAQARNYNSFLHLSGTSGNVVGAGWAGAGPSGNGNFSVFKYAGPQAASTVGNGGPVPLNTTTMLVAKIDFSGNTAPDTVRLFLNPGAIQPSDASAVSVLTGLNLGDLTSFGVHWGASSTVDEIVFAGSYTDLVAAPVPEPSEGLMMTLGLMSVFAMVKVRKARAARAGAG